jgi:hypothetical protein
MGESAAKIGAREFEGLFDFLDNLRASGYVIDTRQWMALNDLLIALVAKGETFDNVGRLKTIIAPLVCSTPAQQIDFYSRFEQWATFGTKQPIGTLSKKKQLEHAQSQKRTFSFILILIWFAAVVFNIVIFVQASTGNAAIVAQTLDLGSWTNRVVIYLSGFFIVTLVSFGIRWFVKFYRENQYITREIADQPPVYTKILVNTYVQEILPFWRLSKIIHAFRRRMQTPSNEVDIDRTIEHTLANSAWLDVIYRQRQVMPEYLVLIDRKSYLDQQARIVQEMLQQLVSNGVWIHLYEFSGDPRICFPFNEKERPLQLSDIHAHHPDARLLVFSGMSELTNPLTGDLQSWIEPLTHWHERAIFTPDVVHQVLFEELRARDFTVLPITLDGLASLIRAFESDNVPIFINDDKPLPVPLLERPLRWTGRDAPTTKEAGALLLDIKRYLGENGFYWLSACAVYPELRWELTLYLGSTLKGDDGKTLLNVNTLLRLARLPWFRQGYMPDWYRLDLIKSVEPEQELSIRYALEKLLDPNLEGEDEFSLPVAINPRNWLNASLKNLLGNVFKPNYPESLEKDVVFIKFIRDSTRKRISVRIAKELAKILDLSAKIIAEMRKPEPADLIVMAISWSILTLALVGGTKVLWDIFSGGIGNTNTMWAQITVLSIAFIIGWVVSLVSIRALHNLILPLVIRVYALFITLGIAGTYLRVVYKLLVEDFEPAKHYLWYSIVLAGLLFVLAGLHLLIEDHNIRPFCIPVLFSGLIHLVAIVVHYIFMLDSSNPPPLISGIIGDVYFFIFSLIMVVLIATNLPFVKPLQRVIDKIFPAKHLVAKILGQSDGREEFVIKRF